VFRRQKKQLNELTVLGSLIDKMEQKGLDNPEYLIRNIELISNIIQILENLKEDMKAKLGNS